MVPISIVIVCKNEAGIIAETLKSLEGISDDIIVYDSGSTDDTMSIVRKFPVHLFSGHWEGFGKTKNKANEHAKYDWILSLDADEAVDTALRNSLLQFNPQNGQELYKVRFRNFLGSKPLHYGEWGYVCHIRLFNRKNIQWDEEPVHEQLIRPKGMVTHQLGGFLIHRTAENIQEYAEKTVRYALLNAEKYHRRGLRAGWHKIYLAPGFNFFYYYILKMGFLDGFAGLICAKMTAHYTFLKYARLRELNRQ